ncbi:MAG: hypothetical protein LQ344_000493 [Seirophora lacunosa]|nr:MAG: hypothetical protein LQ344_000493 [Seirophora lacunosa]
MSARSLSLPLYKVPIGSSLLPFLYHTRTIQSPAKCCLKAQRSFHATHGRQKKSAIPFEHDLEDHVAGYDQIVHGNKPDYDPSRPPRPSTITASEKAVFERISRQLAADATETATKEKDPLDDDLEDEQSTTGDPYGDLNAIFDDALQKLRQSSQQDDVDNSSMQDARLDALPKDYQTAVTAYKNKSGAKRLDLSVLRYGEDFEAIQQSVVDHKRKVLGLLDGAGSDTQIWRVLNTEVFTLIKRHDSLKKEAEARETAKKPKRKKGRLPKAEREAVAAAEQKQSLRATKKTTQEAKTEAILTSNYGDYCLAAMRHLRRGYPTSPYCMNLLPTIKRLGPISHVLAASVDLYNEALFLLWKEYSDLHGMADLIVEMGNQGLPSNEVTLRIVRMVRNAKRFARAQDKPMKGWWDLHPAQEGYRRLEALAKTLRRELFQAQVRKSVEEMESRNKVEAGRLLDRGGVSRGNAVKERGRRVERARADEATFLDGGLGHSPSQRAEI